MDIDRHSISPSNSACSGTMRRKTERGRRRAAQNRSTLRLMWRNGRHKGKDSIRRDQWSRESNANSIWRSSRYGGDSERGKDDNKQHQWRAPHERNGSTEITRCKTSDSSFAIRHRPSPTTLFVGQSVDRHPTPLDQILPSSGQFHIPATSQRPSRGHRGEFNSLPEAVSTRTEYHKGFGPRPRRQKRLRIAVQAFLP